MPYYRRRRYYSRRSRYRPNTRTRRYTRRPPYKRRRYSRNYRRKSKYRNPIPSQALMRFKYIDANRSYNMTYGPPTVNDAYFLFRGNSIYDPQVSVGGGTVLNFDLYFGVEKFYQKYKVYGCKINVYLQNQFAITGPFYLSLYPILEGGHVVTSPTIQKMTSIKHCVTKRFYEKTIKAFRVKNYLSTRKLYDVKDLDDRDFNGGSGTNPAQMWNWVVHVWRETGMTSVPNMYVNLNCKLTYYTSVKRTEAPYPV